MLENNIKNNIFLFFAIFMLTFTCQPFSVKAEDPKFLENKITPKEQAVFAFFRAADTSPDYEFWIKASAAYKALPEKKQEAYLLKEQLRLGRGYGLFDQNKDLLELEINILVKYMPGTPDDEEPRIIFKFLNMGEDKTPIFNYAYGPDIISLIINRLDSFADLPLTEEQEKSVLEKIPYEDDFFDATLTVHVRASKADEPAQRGPMVQWIMYGDVAYLKCNVDSRYTYQEYTLWDYVAPWHAELFRIKNMPEEEKYPHPFDLFKD